MFDIIKREQVFWLQNIFNIILCYLMCYLFLRVPNAKLQGGVVINMKKIEKRLRKHKKRVVLLVIVSVLLVSTGVLANTCFSSVASASNTIEHYKYYKCYIIQGGDTFWSIAQAHRTAEYESIDSYLKEVYEINKIGNTESIMTGHTLILPYYDTVLK